MSTKGTSPPMTDEMYTVVCWRYDALGEPDAVRLSSAARLWSTRSEAAEHADRLALDAGELTTYAVARVSLIEDDPHDVPDEDIEGGASNGE